MTRLERFAPQLSTNWATTLHLRRIWRFAGCRSSFGLDLLHARLSCLRSPTLISAGTLNIPAHPSCLWERGRGSTARNGRAFQASSMGPRVKLSPPLKIEHIIE